MIPIGVYVFLSLVVGVGLGMKGAEVEGRAVGVELPEKRDTVSRMMGCRAFCGKDRTGSYDALTGYCECSPRPARRK